MNGIPARSFMRLPIKNVGFVVEAAAAINWSISSGRCCPSESRRVTHLISRSNPPLDGLAAASQCSSPVLIVNNDLGAGFARALRGLIARAIVDYKDMV